MYFTFEFVLLTNIIGAPKGLLWLVSNRANTVASQVQKGFGL